jgi:hypothetical protein
MAGLSFDIKVDVKGKGGFQITREKLLAQIEKERAKPPTQDRDNMLAHMESLLANMG